MKIYYKYADANRLIPNKGDRINEINQMVALSTFADVYYAGHLFGRNLPGFGFKSVERKIKEINPDIVFTRASNSVFDKAKGRFRIIMAAPFDEKRFRQANIVGTWSEAWAKMLREGIRVKGLNPKGEKFPNARSLNQSCDFNFRPLQEKTRTKKIRAEIGGDFIIGCFGRIVNSNYPELLFNAIEPLVKQFPNIRFLFGINNHDVVNLRFPNTVVRKFSYFDMPYALSACDLTFTGGRFHEWDYCGSLKSIESALCGVPVICRESIARRELLGDHYPFMIPKIPFEQNDISGLMNAVYLFYANTVMKKRWINNLTIGARKYTITENAKHLEKVINEVRG